jgi:hypothetical protein
MTMKLSFDSVTAIPSANKADSIRSYVKSQQHNASAYTAEGKIFQASWKDHLALPADAQCALPLEEESGFRTPTLIPRTLKTKSPSEINLEIIPADSEKAGKKNRASKKVAHDSHKSMDEKHLDRRVTASNDAVPVTNRVRAESVDGEREYRTWTLFSLTSIVFHSLYIGLAQRRARKRAKRDIINPDRKSTEQIHSAINDTDREVLSRPSKGNKDKKGKKAKLPAGLALLHGFSASNIGQKRLTVSLLSPNVVFVVILTEHIDQLKPGACPGVFNKGKASATTRINKNKKSGKRGLRNKTHFLYVLR